MYHILDRSSKNPMNCSVLIFCILSLKSILIETAIHGTLSLLILYLETLVFFRNEITLFGKNVVNNFSSCFIIFVDLLRIYRLPIIKPIRRHSNSRYLDQNNLTFLKLYSIWQLKIKRLVKCQVGVSQPEWLELTIRFSLSSS